MLVRSDFYKKLERAWVQSGSSLCVGIDATPEMMPESLVSRSLGLFEFGTAVVDAVNPYVCAFKINHAHFASTANEPQLASLIEYIHSQHPTIPVILDAKRNDIDATARKYAIESFERYDADAVTVNPYLGWDAIQPFLEYEGRGVIVLCKTSNPGAAWIQDVPREEPIYLRVAARVQEESNPNLMLVVGATHPEALGRVRETARDVTLLVPGVGAQGGNPTDVLHYGRRGDGFGLVINCSRSVIQHNPRSSDYFDLVRESAAFYNRQFAHGND